jgi:stearoyl-CoA desaturase (delta-9 desaturase)
MQGLHHAHSDSPQDPHSVGEGYQNNHHRYPASAKFSHQPWEIDFGYGISLLLETLGVLRIHRALLIPSPTATAAELAHE